MVIMDSRLRPSRRKHRGHRRRVRPHFAMRRDSLACRASCYMANYPLAQLSVLRVSAAALALTPCAFALWMQVLRSMLKRLEVTAKSE